MLLQRLPTNHDKSLRAWDAADRQLADKALAWESTDAKAPASVWVLNDPFGAISCFLGDAPHVWFNDSQTSHEALALNRTSNGLSPLAACFPVNAESIQQALTTTAPRVVVLRVPKSRYFLYQQLDLLNQLLPEGTTVILGGMQKYVVKAAIEAMKSRIDVVEVLRAEKKARLIVAKTAPCPSLSASFGFDSPELGQYIAGDANVFSHSQLDLGARVMVEALAKAPTVGSALDLACGNGVLALALRQSQPTVDLYISDDSFQAIEAARTNLSHAGDERPVHSFWKNGVPLLDKPMDLVLLNPPFHQGHVIGDHIARMLFEQVPSLLSAHGELWVVGNRHLGYHVALKAQFQSVECIHDSEKFVVLRCTGVK